MAETQIHGIRFKVIGDTDSAIQSLEKLERTLGRLRNASAGKIDIGLSGSLKSAQSNIKKTNGFLGKLFSSIKRIAFYRAIRAAMKEITEGFKEGLQNAYNFSQVVGYRLAASLDNLASKSLKMKNQMGAAFGELIMTVEPIIVRLIQVVTKAMDALARFFAMLGGRTTYLKAVDTMTQFGDSVGAAGAAAKEAMEYLAPFDELNVLPDDKNRGGGSGAGTPDYSSMFEVADVGDETILDSLRNAFDKISEFFQTHDWVQIGENFWGKIKEQFSDRGKASEAMKSFFEALGSVTGAGAGFVFGFAKGLVGSVVEAFRNNLKDKNGDDRISLGELLSGIIDTTFDVSEWVYIHTFKPFLDGFGKAVTGNREFLLSDWLEEQLAKALAWLKKKWNEFAEKVKSFIGIELPTFELNTTNGPSGHSSSSLTTGIKIEAELTGIKDSIPSSKKILPGFTSVLQAARDKIPSADKLISTIANFISRKIGISTTFSSIANFLSRKVGISTTFNSTANFIKKVIDFSRWITMGSSFTKKEIKFGRWISMGSDFIRKHVDYSRMGAWIQMGAEFVKKKVSSAFNRVIDMIANIIGRRAKGGLYANGMWHNIAQYATGGTPRTSQLFIARERGPELVGTLGGHTAVMNNNQIVESVSSGVARAIAGIRFQMTGLSAVSTPETGEMDEELMYNAMLRALNDADVFPDEIDLDGAVVYRKMVQRNKAERARTGVNPMMAS